MIRRRRAFLAPLAICAMLLAASCEPAPKAPFRDSSVVPPGSTSDRGWFAPGETWWGDFGDPHVIRVGSTYYAYSTPTAGRSLPLLTSTDLKSWQARGRYTSGGPPNQPGYSVVNDHAVPAEIRGVVSNGARVYSDTDWGRYDNNDALVRFPSWGLYEPSGKWVSRAFWAPGVAQIGSTWYAYSAVKVSTSSDDPNGFGRFCLTVASSASPAGPFRDISGTGPIQCQSTYDDPAGSIDPYPFVDDGAGNQPYLLWKAAGKRSLPGVRNPHPSAIYAAPLDGNGRLTPGRQPVKLLETNEGGWEGLTIENAAMIRYGGRYYLFYSGNDFRASSNGDSRYATGYAICPQGPRGTCFRKTVSKPFLASTATEKGPGGASPFVDTNGRLRLAYAFYWPGENRPKPNHAHPRRLNIATLSVTADGSLVAQRQPWSAGCSC